MAKEGFPDQSLQGRFQQEVSPYLVAAGLEVLTFPLHSVKTLVQVGHEPLPIYEGSSWFGYGKKTFWLPNVYTYAGHIRKTDGLGGLFRGLSPKIFQGLVQQAVAHHLGRALPPVSEAEMQEPGREIQNLCKATARSTVLRLAAITAGYPLEVVSVRMIVFFVGRETPYATFLGAVKEIYRVNGLTGFFAGLVPRLLCEVASLWGFEILSHLVIRTIGSPKKQSDQKEMQAYVRSIVQYVVRMVTYPFMLTSTMMIVDGSGMQAELGIPFDGHGNWWTCFRSLYRHGLTMRGSNLLRRPVNRQTAV